MQLAALLLALLPVVSLASPLPQVVERAEDADYLAIRDVVQPWAWAEPAEARSPADPDVIAEIQRRLVYNPRIVEPTAATVWGAGKTQTVAWSTEDIPDEARSYRGTIKLGYEPADGSGGLNLKWTLASDFLLTDDQADITLPSDLEPRDDYIIVLMGDSGNASPQFTIEQPTFFLGAGLIADAEPETEAAEGLFGRDVPARS